MDPALAFQILNAVVMPWWILWIGSPRSGWARRAASHGGPFLGLGVVYTVLLATTLLAPAEAGAVTGFDFDGLRGALSTPVGFLAGWTHYLAFDLFVGAWIVRESARLDAAPRVALFFTLMSGPLGLGLFLLQRGWRLRTLGGLGQTGAA